MKRLLVLFVAALISAGSSYAASPTTKRHKPDFTLTISTTNESLTPHKEGRKVVSVVIVEKNISGHTIDLGRTNNPDEWYTMSVLHDGNPVPFTNEYIQDHSPQKYDPSVPVTISPYTGTLNPGKIQDFEVLLSEIYDLSAPGKYEITFSRGTDPGRPDNVDVKSNTITITVLPAEAQ